MSCALSEIIRSSGDNVSVMVDSKPWSYGYSVDLGIINDCVTGYNNSHELYQDAPYTVLSFD